MARCQEFASFCRQLKGSLHFPPILKKNPSIQNLNETTVNNPLPLSSTRENKGH